MAQWILVKPTMADEREALSFVKEYAAVNSMPVQGGSSLGDMPYAQWLAHIDRYDRGEDLPKGHVASSCFFLKDGLSERIYGVISVRWQLTPALMNKAGNIGYSIRPDERRKGLGSIQLGLAVEKCREAGLRNVLLTCAEGNIASSTTMLSQGAVEDRAYIDEDGSVYRRFWICTGHRVVLRAPTPANQAAAEEMIAEFHAHGENMLYGSGGAGDIPYADWLVKMDRYARALPPETVPQFVRFSVLLPENKLIGYVALRPRLSDALFRIGGNIGYCIRPSMRKMGYGHAQLGMALAWMREQGINQALLTCSDTNKASAATILSHGGVEDRAFVDELGIPHRRFWIPTGKRLILRKPSLADERAIAEMAAEFAQNGEDFICGSSGVNRLPYPLWLNKIEKGSHAEGLAPDRMPQHTYVSFIMPGNKPVGFVAIRPELNEDLRREAGNIGYSIRPSMRKKGYGRAQLQAALRNIGEYDVAAALITCDEKNLASAATVLSCGGREIRPSLPPSGMVQRRFVIDLPKPGNME